MTEKNMSEENRQKMFALFEVFLRSKKAEQELDGTMWLSVVDFSWKAGLSDLAEFAEEQFFESFDMEKLQTTSLTKKASEDPGEGRGRRTRGSSTKN